MSIMAEIVETRRTRIKREGFNLGTKVPERRAAPLVPFGRDPFVICEIKRRSPSRGDIAADLDAPSQAARYLAQGARTVSVLTEEDHFHGSLADLMAVKSEYPNLCVLRKDLLLSEEDVEVSYRAGADAILLITGILDIGTLTRMYQRAHHLGMSCLVEVHTDEDVEKASRIEPRFTGINSRDLRTFTVDLTLPLQLQARIGWETSLVFESGMHTREHAAFATSSGFCGILVGEAVVREPALVGELIAGVAEGSRGEAVNDSSEASAGPGNRSFWRTLYSRRRRGRPLVKVCGLTNQEDALLADELGADLIGFVLAPSKRRASPAVVREIGTTRALKVGVVVLDAGSRILDAEVLELLESGRLDAIQFHGDEAPEECYHLAFPYFKALQLKDADDSKRMAAYRCPRVLIDARTAGLRGGTGTQVGDAIISEVKRRGPLWLAGGLGPENVGEILLKHSPELVDASSLLESEPGKKDPDRLGRFFSEIERVGAEVAGSK
jgi:indole-3-glycerol phosphate synthase / phosphoribosylanthranilate isomerase